MLPPHAIRVLRARVLAPLAVALTLAAVGVPAAAEEVLRLPKDIVPTFQEIRLDLDARKQDYSGSVRIEFRVATQVPAIHFHAQEMTLTRVELKGKKGPVRKLEPKEVGDGLLRASDAMVIAPGEYTLSIDFTNDFDRRATSLYRLETGGEAYTFTQFQAIDARMAFPCFDEPAFKFPYQAIVTVPEAHQAVSNTPAEKTSVRNGVKTVVFRKTQPLPSYLLAFATGPLEFVPIWGLSVPGRVVVPKGSTHLAKTAAEMTPPLLKAVEAYFGSPYPYEKLDLIAVPEFSPGAMENPGAITYGDRFLLFDPKTMSTSQKRLFAVFTAHELAHMWFGDLVTMRWWDDLWLNESFAEWMGDKIAHQVYPELEVDTRALQELQSAMLMDARLSTRAIRQPVQSVANLLQAADALTYKKGQATLGMFERWVGPETFRKGVLAYIRKHRWGNAEAKDLWDALSEAAGVDLHAPMATFLDQSGIPLVRAELLERGQVRLTQRRFLNHGVAAPEDPLWHIPVTMRYSDGDSVRTHSILLREPTMTIALPGLNGAKVAWLHPNAAGGYYRWSVDGPALHALAAAAPRVLDPAQRIGFVQNLTSLLSAGEIRGDDYLRLIAGFGSDEDPGVLGTLGGPLSQIEGTFVDEALEDEFAAYVRRVLGPAAERFGLNRKPEEAAAVSILRPQLLTWLAQMGRDEKALAHAERLAKSFLTDRGSVDPSLVNVILPLSALRGDSSLFEEYRKRFEAAAAPTDRMPLLDALGSFRDPALRERALAYALSPPVRPHEVFTIPQAMAETPAYRQQVFEWTLAHYDEIVKKIPPLYAVYLPYAGGGCSEARLAKAKEFFAIPAHSPPGTEVELARMLESGGDCIGLRAREGAAVTRYLTQLAEAK
jgi:cytosol alanyl aminopeptidase